MTRHFQTSFAFFALLLSVIFPLSANAQASGSADGDVTANSLTIHDNAVNATTSFLFPDGEAWLSNNIWLGNSNYSYVTAPEYGPALFFGGATSGNSDLIAFYRYNIAGNVTEFRLSVGDDVNNATQCDDKGNCYNQPDTFVIGGTDANNGGVWTPRFTFTSTGMLGIGTSQPQAALDVKGSIMASGFFIEGSSAETADTAAVTNDLSLGAKAQTAAVKKRMPLIPTCTKNQYVTANGQAFYCVNLPGK